MTATMTTEIKWDVSPRDAALIGMILDRAIYEKAMLPQNRKNTEMDITACHLNGTPLRLWAWATSSRADFIHDLMGIDWHMDRTTGKLGGGFLPRFHGAESGSSERPAGGEPMTIAYIAMGVARAIDTFPSDYDMGEADLVVEAIKHAPMLDALAQRASEAGCVFLYDLVEMFGADYANAMLPNDAAFVTADDAKAIAEAILSDHEA